MAASSAEHAVGTQGIAAPTVTAASQSYYEKSEELYRILCIGEYFVFASEAMGHSRTTSTTAIPSCKYNTIASGRTVPTSFIITSHAGWKSFCDRMTEAGWVRKMVEFGADKSWICMVRGTNLVPTAVLSQTKALTSK